MVAEYRESQRRERERGCVCVCVVVIVTRIDEAVWIDDSNSRE